MIKKMLIVRWNTEAFWVGTLLVGTLLAISKTNCPPTNWKIYRRRCEPGTALALDYLRSKKDSISNEENIHPWNSQL